MRELDAVCGLGLSNKFASGAEGSRHDCQKRAELHRGSLHVCSLSILRGSMMNITAEFAGGVHSASKAYCTRRIHHVTLLCV